MSAARWWRRHAALTAACALASGCALHPVGPDYRKPALPDATLDASQAKAFSPTSPPGEWWSLYQDPLLDGYVSEALRANLDLRAAASRIDIMQAVLDQTRASEWPSTGVSASAARQRNWIDGSPFLMVYNTISASLGVSYEIDLAGRIRRSVEAASATREEQQFAFAATQIRIVANTVGSYAGVCQANAALAAAKRTVRIDEDSLDITQRLARGGVSSRLDVTRARAQLESDRARLPVIEAQRMTALYALAVTLGRQPDHYPRDAASCAAPPVIGQPLPVGDGLALLRRRPDVAQAERALAAATANIGVATANLYPQVSLGASIGFSGSTPGNTFSAQGHTWSLGPALQWSFPNLAATKAQIRQAGASADLARTNYDSTVLNALKETEGALNTYTRELDREASLRQARDTSRTAYAQAQKLYLHGVTPYLDVLQAQKQLAEAEQQLVDSSGAIASEQIGVFLALGGGWDVKAQRAADEAQAVNTQQ